eukprot:CAMPEP_0117003034 /NCGR_PEP_ID=MMETSP0472-20121206/4485_1 /TAXON_ID=693140 ORGANISM="Tiarina fusus, Strain LIS" /NCGR_SAMPLE_ID=MMETSP0472 /ASSEMBLY_ACC=CAM_ASM_000603 /LENGTH=466 /DNA_ID=CAMNT_0004703541 /DNA_START=181 /DNA_END=1577 /DNA_ORIENTATION=-
MADNDELVSQWMAVTGSSDTARAQSYLEMSGGNLETAVGLPVPEAAMGGGAAGFGGGPGGGDGDVRAPDATQTMRLMDDVGMGGMGSMGGMNPYMHIDPMIEEQLQQSAFSAPSMFDVRETVNAAVAAADSEDEKDEMDGDDDQDQKPKSNLARLADMFAPPENLIYKEGGFDGARTMAKDNKRWLLVNIQRDSEFSSHALNRDVWRDELVENLVREGFIFWQAMDVSPEGQVYCQRYHVGDYPHIGIIDPRTRRLMWKKEGWTQENPMTAELFAETAMDFCSRHSFDKPPQAPRPSNAASRPAKRPMNEMSEDEQLQAAMRASLQAATGDNDDDDADYEVEMEDDDDGVEYLGTGDDVEDSKPEAEAKKEPSLLDQLLETQLGDEPAAGARIQIRMPDGKRQVRKFDPAQTVKSIYAYIAQNNEEAKGGKAFVLMAGFPPKDLLENIDNTVESCKLSGQAITVRW